MKKLTFVKDNKVYTDSATLAESFGLDHDYVIYLILNSKYYGDRYNMCDFVPHSYIDNDNNIIESILLTSTGFTLIAGFVIKKYCDERTYNDNLVKYTNEYDRLEERVKRKTLFNIFYRFGAC